MTGSVGSVRKPQLTATKSTTGFYFPLDVYSSNLYSRRRKWRALFTMKSAESALSHKVKPFMRVDYTFRTSTI